MSCGQSERLYEHALGALPSAEALEIEAHAATCPECRKVAESLRPVIESFVSWPTDVLRPAKSLWGRLSQRIAAEAGGEPVAPEPSRWVEPVWEDVAPGISCKLLATDGRGGRVSMLVRLAPGADYPPHTHAGLEELHLLDGELWINDRKLHPGDHNRAEAGTSDTRVWSETGCTCVLVTSANDVLH